MSSIHPKLRSLIAKNLTEDGAEYMFRQNDQKVSIKRGKAGCELVMPMGCRTALRAWLVSYHLRSVVDVFKFAKEMPLFPVNLCSVGIQYTATWESDICTRAS